MIALVFLSIKVAFAAPRLSASSPRAPVPAKTSRTLLSIIPIFASTLKMLSRVLPNVGRVFSPLGVSSTVPLAVPEIIRNIILFPHLLHHNHTLI